MRLLFLLFLLSGCNSCSRSYVSNPCGPCVAVAIGGMAVACRCERIP